MRVFHAKSVYFARMQIVIGDLSSKRPDYAAEMPIWPVI